MSHLTDVRQDDVKVKARLLRLLGKEEGWLHQQCYDAGLAWLHQHFGFDPRLERALATMPAPKGGHNLFWAWWLNDWQHADGVLNGRLKVLPNGVACYTAAVPSGQQTLLHTREDLEYYYQQLHDPKTSEVKMPGFVLEEAKRYLRTALPEE